MDPTMLPRCLIPLIYGRALVMRCRAIAGCSQVATVSEGLLYQTSISYWTWGGGPRGHFPADSARAGARAHRWASEAVGAGAETGGLAARPVTISPATSAASSMIAEPTPIAAENPCTTPSFTSAPRTAGG